MAIITGSGGRGGPSLDSAAIEALMELTPPYTRKLHLAEPLPRGQTGAAPSPVNAN
jgi:hypothetical protein